MQSHAATLATLSVTFEVIHMNVDVSMLTQYPFHFGPLHKSLIQ